MRRFPFSVLISILILILVFGSSQAQNCRFDRANPSLESARTTFLTLDYKCAELELIVYLQSSNLTTVQKGDAHALLAAVYYASMKDEADRKSKVLEQFVNVFSADKNWQGELEVKSDEFVSLMEEAKGLADEEKQTTIPTTKITTSTDCPSSTVPLLSSGITAVSGLMYMLYTGKANDKWDEYETGDHEMSLYDDYKSTNKTRQVFGAVTLVSGGVSAYLWVKYFMKKGNCDNGSASLGQDTGGFKIYAGLNSLTLTYSF